MAEQLDQIPCIGELYAYRGVPDVDEDAPPLCLPWHQGDIFENVDLPGLESTMGMLFLHPCTMRKRAALVEQVTMIAVEEFSGKKVLDGDDAWDRHWKSRYSVMPLANLRNREVRGGTHVADFSKLATVPSSELNRSKRIAALTDAGRLHLLQRSFHHFSRLVVPLGDLRAGMRGVNREIELQHDWVEAACDACKEWTDESVARAERDFDAYLTEEDRRQRLSDIQQETDIVCEVMKEIESRYKS
ncbi:hypothetical protein OIU91_20725 [Streptomyces sp. NBC_01456]|uniref:hypothetical protein n=1 Tax=unclassified Streptomyces TaxID=2593676 RepID=UPI002E326855|nr:MULTISPECIES: hypothetical protein [unclassified Streptomyces]